MSRRHWFWGGFLLVLLTGLMLTLFSVIRGGGQWASQQVEQTELVPPAWKEVIQLTLDGAETFYLEPEAVSRIRQQTGDWLDQRQVRVQQSMNKTLDQALDPAFEQALVLVPAFADWYYSLGGEYMRLFHAAAGDLPAFLEERLEELVFGPAGTAQSLDTALVQLDKHFLEQLQTTTVDLQVLLRQLVRQSSVQPGAGELRVQGTWDPAGGISRSIQPYVALSGADLGRQGVATGAGVAASAVVFKKLGANTVAKTASVLAAKQSAGMLVGLASKLGLKTAAKSGVLAGAGAGAAGGAGLCAGSLVGAPLAPGCALVGGILTGTATWLLVDTAVLEADELLNREQLEQQMRAALQEERVSQIVTPAIIIRCKSMGSPEKVLCSCVFAVG